MLYFTDFQAHVIDHWQGSPVPQEKMFLALAIAGETGELCEHIKKMHRDDRGFLTEERRITMLKELGDVLFYITELANVLGSSLSEVAEINKQKLDDRRARGVVGGSGDDR